MTMFRYIPNELVGAVIRFNIDTEVARIAAAKAGAL